MFFAHCAEKNVEHPTEQLVEDIVIEEETEESVSVELRLLTKEEWESRVAFPADASADVTLRRLQKCHFPAGG